MIIISARVDAPPATPPQERSKEQKDLLISSILYYYSSFILLRSLLLYLEMRFKKTDDYYDLSCIALMDESLLFLFVLATTK